MVVSKALRVSDVYYSVSLTCVFPGLDNSVGNA